VKKIRVRPIQLVALAIAVNIAVGCGHLEIGLPGAAGAAGVAGVEAGGSSGDTALAGAAGELTESSAGAAGEESSAGAAGEEKNSLTCHAPNAVWQGCPSGQPCVVCSSRIANYPLYLSNHPRCTSWYACDHSVQSDCSSDCPPPSGADQCDGTLGNWRGCRGLGCYVCAELVVDYPNYFKNHRFCIENGDCKALYFTCSLACPAPTESDR
jgi:hypothetical protein